MVSSLQMHSIPAKGTNTRTSQVSHNNQQQELDQLFELTPPYSTRYQLKGFSSLKNLKFEHIQALLAWAQWLQVENDRNGM